MPYKDNFVAFSLTSAIFHVDRGISQWATRTFYSNNTFSFSGDWANVSIDNQAQQISMFGKKIGQNASLIRRVEIPFPIPGLRYIGRGKPNLASLQTVLGTFTRLDTLALRLNLRRRGKLRLRPDYRALIPTLYAVNEYLQHYALVKIICVVRDVMMLSYMQDKVTGYGWTVVIDER